MRRLLRLLPLALLIATLVPASAGAAGAGSTLLVSRADGLGPVPPAYDGFSSPGAVSADGRYAVFNTSADGFADGTSPDPNVSALVLRDRQTGTNTLVSRSDGLNGAPADADARRPDVAVAANGHVLVAFDSEAKNLADHDTGPVAPPGDREEMVWLRDVTAGTTRLVSRTGTNGPPANRFAADPSIGVTQGGVVVAFSTGATNLPGGQPGVFLRSVDAQVTTVVSCRNRDCSGNPVAASGGEPDLRVIPSEAGTLCAPPQHLSPCVMVAFTDQDGRLSGDPFHVHVMAAVAAAPVLPGFQAGPFDNFRVVSRKDDATLANQGARTPAVNSDGRAIAFISTSTNLTGDAVPANVLQAYLRRIDTGTNQLLTTNGGAGDKSTNSIDLGGDVNHLRAVFQSDATNLGGTGAFRRDYVRDVAAGGISGLAPATDISQGNPVVSADGSSALFAAFTPQTEDEPPPQRFGRVRLQRLGALDQPSELVSRPSGTDALPPSSDFSFLPGPNSVSADGRYVTFASHSAGLAEGGDDRVQNVFVRDLLTDHTVLVSRADGASGAGVTADAFGGAISADGRKVLFTTSARNIDPGAPRGTLQAYLRDLDANTTTIVSRAGAGGSPTAQNSFGQAISSDGQVVVFSTTTPLDPAADDGQPHLYVRDLSTGATKLVDRDSGANGTVPAAAASGAAIDAHGDHVAWSTRGSIGGLPAVQRDRVFVRDLRTNVTTLVSRADGADGAPADGQSFAPSINASGNVIAFSSDSPNLGAKLREQQVYVRDVAAGTTVLASGLPGTDTLAPFTRNPAIDAAGDRVAFVAGSFGPPQTRFQTYVRDLPSHTTEIVSRAPGADGAPADSATSGRSTLSANGDCVVFDGNFAGLDDGFASSSFSSVHMRVLRGECPAPRQPVTGEGPPPGNDGGDGGPGTPPRPVLSSLAVVPSRFWTGGRRSGTTIRFKLSHAARVTLRFDRLSTGHRRGRRCVSDRKARGKRCTIVKRAGSMTVNGKAGSNRQRFSGKLKSKRLALGRYRITATVAGGSGKRRAARAVVVRAPKARVRRR